MSMTRQATVEDLGLASTPSSDFPASISVARDRIKRILREKSKPDIWMRDESASPPRENRPHDLHNNAAAQSRASTPDIRSDVGLEFVKDLKWWQGESPTRTETSSGRRLHFASVRQRQDMRSRQLSTPASVRVYMNTFAADITHSNTKQTQILCRPCL